MAFNDTENAASGSSNADEATIRGFGAEWSRFDQTGSEERELSDGFEAYFRAFPWEALPPAAVGVDVGCGSGRWARFAAPRVGTLHCVDASEQALAVAKRNLVAHTNVRFHHAYVDRMPFAEASLDFGYSLGVLHHLPDTQAALTACVRHLKPGAPFLCYLYYRFDNRPAWYRALWAATEAPRWAISRMPPGLKHVVTDLIATGLYWPLARGAALAEAWGANVENLPLAQYRGRSFYTMRTDALDRFGTRMEKRFTATEIRAMFERAGLERIRMSDAPPYWCAVGFRRG
jgi:ubiquinone/menaquinone biosynthesis C-methylase UbiE